MSTIQEIARDALKEAHTDLIKARRTLLLAAGVLALIHLLTVYPYLEASREIAGVEASMAANASLLARLEPEISRLQTAGTDAAADLTALLDGITAEMIASFAELRDLVARAVQGEPPDLAPPLEPAPFPPMQQMPAPDQLQMPVPNIAPPIQAPDFPPMQQMAPNLPAPGPYVAPALDPILAALAAGQPEAYDRLIAYARRNIVGEAYARAERDWRERIRPAYRQALAATEEGARRAADQAPASAAQTAAALRAAADEMARQRAVVDAILISHDNTVDQALGTDWWRTVQGKGAYADAVAESIHEQMRQIALTAAAPSVAIREALALQEQLQGRLRQRQEELKRQFAEQRAQLAALSGTSGVVPVDLASFIGLFPLVLGLVLGLVLLRAGQARHQAALAAADLARTSEDREIRVWLTRRALGGGAPGLLLVTALLAFGAVLWIALAAVQVAGSPIDPPLTPWLSGVLATLLVLAAAAWDAAAIRRLAAALP